MMILAADQGKPPKPPEDRGRHEKKTSLMDSVSVITLF